MKKISEITNKALYNIIRKNSYILASLIINWEKIVGSNLQKKTYPYKVIKSKERGQQVNILKLAVFNSVESIEIAYQQELIRERINNYLGNETIHKIRITTIG